MEREKSTFSVNQLQRKWLTVFGLFFVLLGMVVVLIIGVLTVLKKLDDGPAHRPSEFSNRR